MIDLTVDVHKVQDGALVDASDYIDKYLDMVSEREGDRGRRGHRSTFTCTLFLSQQTIKSG